MVLLDLNVYKRDLENKLIDQDEQMLELQSKVTILQETSSLSSAQQQVAIRKQQAIRQLVGQLGDRTDFVDNRSTETMDLTMEEQQQLTKMSLSKIVTNLRNKLREEEKRNQSISNKLDQILKEKDQIKQKYQQLQKEFKMKGSFIREERHTSAPPATNSKSLGAVKSRIDTGIAKPEVFTGYQSSKTSAGRSSNASERPKKMSFKQRRESFKMDFQNS